MGMRVVIVKYEEKLTPLIVSDHETVADLMAQWQKTSNISGSFQLCLVGQSDEFLPETTVVKNLPMPSAGYSSIEVYAVRVATLNVIIGGELVRTNASLSSKLSSLEEALCKSLKCPKRPFQFSKDSQTLCDADKTLHDYSISPGDTVLAEATFHVIIENINEEVEDQMTLSASTPLKSLFDDDVPKTDQRFYDSNGRQLNSEEPIFRSIGLAAGISFDAPYRVLYVRRMAISVQPPPVSRDGFAEPVEQHVFVWPNKSVACILPRDKADLAVWFNGKVIVPPETFWNSGVRPYSQLLLDKKITVSIKKDEAVVYKVELQRSSRIRDLMTAVIEKEGRDLFDFFFASKPLDASDSAFLRHCGIKDGASVEIRYRSLHVVATYEDREYDFGSLPVFTSFSDMLRRMEDKLAFSLPANSYFQCKCGRRISMDEEAGQAMLPMNCCPDTPRKLEFHRFIDVKVVDNANKLQTTAAPQHIHVDSSAQVQDVLNELEEFSGARLVLSGQPKRSTDLVRKLHVPTNLNRSELQLEKKIAVGVIIQDKTYIRWQWPSNSLGTLMLLLQAEELIDDKRVMVMDKTLHLASYSKYNSPCGKKLSDYGIHDGTVITIKQVSEEKFATFRIIASKWDIKNFNISVPVPPTKLSVIKAVIEKLKNTRKEGVTPILMQVHSVDENGKNSLFAAANYWVTTAGRAFSDPAVPARFRDLDPTVLYTPDIPTKIHIRRWSDGSE